MILETEPRSVFVSLPSDIDPACAASRPDSARWFAEEVHAHESSLKSYLRGSFPAVRDVEDVVQESFLRVWKAHRTQPIRSTRGFLFQVARRLAFDVLRRRRASPIDEGKVLAGLNVCDGDPDAAQRAVIDERRRMLIEAVAALPNRYREIVILRKLEDVSQKEVAARLRISERTVENLLARGVRRCEGFLRRRGLHELFEP